MNGKRFYLLTVLVLLKNHSCAFISSPQKRIQSKHSHSISTTPKENLNRITAATSHYSNLRFKSRPHYETAEDELQLQRRRDPITKRTFVTTIERKIDDKNSAHTRGASTRIKIRNSSVHTLGRTLEDHSKVSFKYRNPIPPNILSRTNHFNVELVDISWLKPHEEVVSRERVQSLYQAIIEWNAYKLPLLVDHVTGAILDGHHRYAVGREMGLSKLPVILVDYLADDSISVDVWEGCGRDSITKEEVIAMSLSDNVYPPKTSKHDFVDVIKKVSIPLPKLL